jgi:hypothetical protein
MDDLMITKPTVFVVGAGGSAPYGFPLGRGLRDQILDGPRAIERSKRSAQPRTYDILKDLGLGSDYGAFLRGLEKSGYSSVDQFLENNPKYTDIGRLVIAAELLPCELESRLFPPRAPKLDHWYEQLANMLNVGEPKYLRNKVTIVTYNYDRSYEHYMANVMLNRLGKSIRGTTIWKHYNHIPIIHLHGKLGEIGPDIDKQKGTVPYSISITPEAVQLAADKITVIHTANPKTNPFIAARQALSEARRIYFIGFGYNSTNLSRLEVFAKKRLSAYAIKGTSRGMSPREWKRSCEIDFNGTMQVRPRYPLSATAFLRNVVEID